MRGGASSRRHRCYEWQDPTPRPALVACAATPYDDRLTLVIGGSGRRCRPKNQPIQSVSSECQAMGQGVPHQVRLVVNIWLESVWLLAQEPAKKAAAENADPWGSLFSLSSPLLPMLAIGIVFYLMMMRPEQKKRKEMEQLLANIKKNDQVVTIGGICGTVVNASPGSAVVTLRVDDGNNTKIKVLRSAISRVGSPEEETSDAKEST